MKHITARLEMINQRGKIEYGRSMYGEDVEIGDLVKYFFDRMPEYVDQAKCNLRISQVQRY
jgi:hypothetical protein